MHIKLAGWQAAQVAGVLEESELAELDGLMDRARTQADGLTQMHKTAAAYVLSGQD